MGMQESLKGREGRNIIIISKLKNLAIKKPKTSMHPAPFPSDSADLDQGLKEKASFKMHCVVVHWPHFPVLFSMKSFAQIQ